MPDGEPRRTQLRRIIERGPAARKQVGEAVSSLLITALVGLAAIGALLIWHLIRRGRLVRDRLAPPKIIHMPDPEELRGSSHDDRPDLDPDVDAVPPA